MSDTHPAWKKMAESAKARLATISERQKETAAVTLNSALALGGNALMGFLHGWKGGIPAPLGVPIDMAGGTILGIAGLIGVGMGKMWGAPLAALGTGFGGYWIGSTFAAIGRRKREKETGSMGPALSAEEAAKLGVQYRPPITAGGMQGGQYAPPQQQMSVRY